MSHSFKVKKTRRQSFLKIVSTFLVSAFLFQELAVANPELLKITVQGGAEAENSKAWARQLLPPIPESIATIEDAYKSPGSNKTLILIQDAHTNNSGQFNVAKTLDLIFKKDPIRYIFLEAGSGNESLSFLRKHASEAKRKQVANSFLINGKLQGTEYLDLTSNHNFVLWGVEDLSLYAKSVATYRAVAKNREKFQKYLAQIDATIKTLKPVIYNPFLLAFDEKYQKFQREEVPMTAYFEILITEAIKLDTSFVNYPHLRALSKLKEMESKIDFKKASQEEQLAISSLSNEDQKDLLQASKENQPLLKLSSSENQVQKAFFALLEEKAATRLNQYPELSKYFLYIKEAKKIQVKAILDEQKTLEKEVFTALSRTQDEESLIKASKNLESLKKLFNLTLTPDEFDAYQKNKQSFDITRLTGFLNKKIMDLKDHYDRAVFLESGYEDIVQKCEEFYSLTYQRDRKFIENLTQKMNAGNQGKAILITGGYHTPNLKYLLKDQGISYINLTPQVLQETNQKRYEELLLNQKIDLISSANTMPDNFAPAVHTNMLMRILRLGKLGVPYDEALAQGLADSPESIKPIIAEMKKREKDLGGPLAEIGVASFVGGRPVEPMVAVAGARMANKITLNNTELILEKGDITRFQADAIIVPANNQFYMGPGVIGSVVRKLGNEKPWKKAQKIAPAKLGDAVAIKEGHVWPYVIHAVNHDLDEFETSRKLVALSTLNALKKADELKLKTTVIPSFGTGNLGLSYKDSAEAMLSTISEYLGKGSGLTRITVVLYEEEGFQAFKRKFDELAKATSSSKRQNTGIPGIQFSPAELAQLSNSLILRFYAGEITDHQDRSISDLWALNDEEFENTHDAIQLLFPDRQLGMFFMMNAAVGGVKKEGPIPVFRDPEIKLLSGNGSVSRKLKAQVLRSFERALQFYGLELKERTGFVEVVPAKNFDVRAKVWLAEPNHNFLRITRILKSLRLAGLEKYSLELFKALERLNRQKHSIIGDSFDYWKEAVNGVSVDLVLTPQEYAADRSASGARMAKTEIKDWNKIKAEYEELISAATSVNEVKRLYRKLAQETHPDKNPGEIKQAEDAFKALSALIKDKVEKLGYKADFKEGKKGTSGASQKSEDTLGFEAGAFIFYAEDNDNVMGSAIKALSQRAKLFSKNDVKNLEPLIALFSRISTLISLNELNNVLNLSQAEFVETIKSMLGTNSLTKDSIGDKNIWKLRAVLEKLYLVRTLRGGEILHVRLNDKQGRVVVLGKFSNTQPNLRMLTVDAPFLFGGIDSGGSSIIELSIDQIVSLSADFEKEPKQTGWQINIGDQLEVDYEGRKIVVTVTQAYFGQYALVAQEKLHNHVENHLGYAISRGKWGASEALEKGEIRKVSENDSNLLGFQESNLLEGARLAVDVTHVRDVLDQFDSVKEDILRAVEELNVGSSTQAKAEIQKKIEVMKQALALYTDAGEIDHFLGNSLFPIETWLASSSASTSEVHQKIKPLFEALYRQVAALREILSEGNAPYLTFRNRWNGYQFDPAPKKPLGSRLAEVGERFRIGKEVGLILSIENNQVHYMTLSGRDEIKTVEIGQVKDIIPPRNAPEFAFNRGDKVEVRRQNKGEWIPATLVEAAGGGYTFVAYRKIHDNLDNFLGYGLTSSYFDSEAQALLWGVRKVKPGKLQELIPAESVSALKLANPFVAYQDLAVISTLLDIVEDFSLKPSASKDRSTEATLEEFQRILHDARSSSGDKLRSRFAEAISYLLMHPQVIRPITRVSILNQVRDFPGFGDSFDRAQNEITYTATLIQHGIYQKMAGHEPGISADIAGLENAKIRDFLEPVSYKGRSADEAVWFDRRETADEKLVEAIEILNSPLLDVLWQHPNTGMAPAYVRAALLLRLIAYVQKGIADGVLRQVSLPVASKLLSSAEPTGARLTTQVSSPVAVLEGSINQTDAVTFIVRVHSETKQTGKLVLGSLLLDYRENIDGSLTIQGLDEKEHTFNPGEWTKTTIGDQRAFQITFSMSDFKQALDAANQTIEEAPISKALNNIKAVGVIDLEGLNPNVKGFDEVVVPILIEELKLAHKRPWGQNAKFLLKGSEALIQRISSQIPQSQDFIVTKEEDLGKDYASASHIIITTPGKSEKGMRHFFIQSIQEGDIPNFRGALRGSLSLARVDKLETTNKDFSEIMDFVGRLLGHEIASPSEYIQVTENPTLIAIEKIRNLYSLPAVMRLPLNQIVQGARLAIRMIQQAA